MLDPNSVQENTHSSAIFTGFDAMACFHSRDGFREALTKLVADAEPFRTVALVAVDICGFKLINDCYGHRVGDLLLQSVAHRLNCVSPSGSILGRISAGVFAVAVGIPAADVADVPRVINHSFAKPFQLDAVDLEVGCRIGVCTYPDAAENADELFHRAEVALHSVNCEGAAPAFFNSRMTLVTREQLNLRARLKQALIGGEFDVFYQPKVNIASGCLIGAEALLRWHHPELGTICPDQFMTVAEASDLIIDIDEWVLRRVLVDLSEWSVRDSDFRVSVNVSARELKRGDLVGRFVSQLSCAHVPPSALEVEITESAAMSDADMACALFKQFKKHGINIALDDFGTGYSSLSYLRLFKFDTIKIDKSFIRESAINIEDRAIIHTIVQLAKSLGASTVAEGVECIGQADLLAARGCDIIQGWLVAKPMDVSNFARLWLQGNKDGSRLTVPFR